jgi:hypothetical protein
LLNEVIILKNKMRNIGASTEKLAKEAIGIFI